MKKILVIGTSYDEQKMIEEIGASSGGGPLKVETTASFGQSGSWWRANPKDVLVLKLPDDASLETFFFKKIKSDLPPTQAVIFIATTVSTALMQVANLLKRVRILKTPVDPPALWKSIEELTTEYPQRQVAPRYQTNQGALIRSELKSGSMLAVIKNISNSGAYFEVNENSLDLEVHEVFRMEVEIPGSKKYEFDCKVVWLKNLPTNNVGIGISFLNKEENLVSTIKGRKS